MPVRAIRLHENDQVASLLAECAAGGLIQVESANSVVDELKASERIPFGHKVALVEIADGSLVHKYDAPIGRATASISRGAHVHVHNVRGLAGTGSLVERVDAPPATDTPEPDVVPVADLRDWLTTVLRASGFSAAATEHVTEHLVEAEASGISTHGLRRLPSLLQRVAAGAVVAQAVPKVSESDALVVVDAHDASGMHALRVAVEALVPVAERAGHAVGLVRHSSHAGAIGLEARRAAMAGMVALVVSNGPPLVAPPGAARGFVSNSPIAVAAPLPNGEAMVVDLATSAVSRDRIRQAAERGESIPDSWAVDPDGRSTQDPVLALAGAMLPLGGDRGFALSLGLEILAGLLPAAATDVLVPDKETVPDAPERIGHFLLVIDPAKTPAGTEFAQRLYEMEARLRVVSGSERGLPGRRRERLRRQRAQAGIPISADLQTALRAVGDALDTPFPALRKSAS